MLMVMIGVHKDVNKNIIGFRVLDEDTGKVMDVPYNDVLNVLRAGGHTVENIGIDPTNTSKLVGSNGMFDRYPTIVNSRLVGNSSLIILEELPENVYKATNFLGEIVTIDEQKAIAYSKSNGIANGKIVKDGQDGTEHISSILGAYRKSKLIQAKKSGDKLVAKMDILGEDRYKLDDRHNAYAVDKDIQELILGRGALGIRPQGFKDCKRLETVVAPDTLDKLGQASFLDCSNLKTVELVEGIKEIPARCFANCKSLKTIKLPNSIEKIGHAAFQGCDSLIAIYTGPNDMDIDYGAVPRGVKIIKGSLNRQRNSGDDGIKATMLAISGDNFRIFDANAKNTQKVMDIPSAILLNALRENKIQISNIIELDNKLVCTTGSFGDYPKVDGTGKLIGSKQPITIINTLDNKGYTIADYTGNTKRLTNEVAVKLAKQIGITNGKIVSIDNVETIVSTGNAYDNIEIAQGKVNNQDDIGINISIKNRASGVKAGTAVDVQVKINDNDVFLVMTPEQKRILKNYYVQHTLDMYSKMAKSIRLNLAPGKADKLAELRGELDWEFAGVWDSGFMGASKCELGHPLRYEYYALPSSEGEKRRRRRLGKDDYEDIVDDDFKLIFGQNCASDFFSISSDDMKKLVKTRETMSEEIKIIADTITNKQEKEKMLELELMYKIISKLGTPDKIKQAFGNYLGETLIRFLANKIPYPKTMMIQVSRKITENPERFFKIVFPEYEGTLGKIFGLDNSLHEGARKCLEFIGDNKIEGEYAYDPHQEASKNNRRDIGGYNKDTRNRRSNLIYTLRANALLDRYTFGDIENLLKFIDDLEGYNRGIYQLLNKAGLDREKIENIVEYAYKHTKHEIEIGGANRILRIQVFNSLILDNRYNKKIWELGSEIRQYITGSAMRSRYNNGPYYLYEGYGMSGGLRQHRFLESAIKDLRELGEYGLENAVVDLLNFIENIDEIERQKELEEEQERLEAEQEEIERKAVEKLREQERKAKEEKERQEAMKSDKVYQLGKLMEKHPKFTEDNEDDYGIKIAKDIIGREVAYEKLTPKQKWRIDTEYKRYEALENGEEPEKETEKGKESKKGTESEKKGAGGKAENNTYKLSDHPEHKEKVEKLQSMADSVEMQEILKEVPIVLKICYTVMRRAEVSDKQLRHIDKAIEFMMVKE